MESSLTKKSHYSSSLSINLLRNLLSFEDEGNNIAISPTRLQTILVLLANWASPSIKESILEHISEITITLNEANKLSSRQNLALDPDRSSNPIIELKTILWAQKDLDVNKRALDKVFWDFPVILKPVDFEDPDLSSEINDTIAEATHGLIKQLNLNFDNETKGLITDTLYFKGVWRLPFEKSMTEDKVFFGSKENTIVPMMGQFEEMDYYETPICQMVRLPFCCNWRENKWFSMRIYLPRPDCQIHDLLQEMSNIDFYLASTSQKVILSLPRFDIESDVDMKQLLHQMGLSCIFNSDNIIPECIDYMKIQDISQKVKIEVDENGAKACVVTYCPMGETCSPEDLLEPIAVMNVNRPFLFEIAEDGTNTILFTGIINNIEGNPVSQSQIQSQTECHIYGYDIDEDVFDLDYDTGEQIPFNETSWLKNESDV